MASDGVAEDVVHGVVSTRWSLVERVSSHVGSMQMSERWGLFGVCGEERLSATDAASSPWYETFEVVLQAPIIRSW